MSSICKKFGGHRFSEILSVVVIEVAVRILVKADLPDISKERGSDENSNVDPESPGELERTTIRNNLNHLHFRRIPTAPEGESTHEQIPSDEGGGKGEVSKLEFPADPATHKGKHDTECDHEPELIISTDSDNQAENDSAHEEASSKAEEHHSDRDEPVDCGTSSETGRKSDDAKNDDDPGLYEPAEE